MRSVLFFLVSAAGGGAAAETPPRTETSANATSPILVPKAPSEKVPPRSPAAPPLRRAISPEMMAQLKTIGQQRVAPAKTAQDASPAPTSAPEATDAVQLEAFQVQEEKYPDFPIRRMLDARGHLDRHYKREPGLRLGAMSLGNDIVARERNEIELAHERMQEMKDLYGLARMAQTPPAPAVKAKVDETRSRVITDAPQSSGAFKEKK